MKKIILSLGMIVFVGAVIAGATGAFFSDTETSTGNVFAAGAIDLKIDNTSYGFDWNDPSNTSPIGGWGQNTNNSWQLSDLTGQLFFNFDDLKPGDYGEDTISLHVNDNDAWACMAFALGATPENGQNEPEIAFPDTTAGADEGELQNYLSFLFWNDDGDNVLEDGEQVIQSLSGLSSSIFSGNWLAIADTSGDNDVPLPGDTTQYIGKGWCFGTITATPVAAGQDVPPTPGNTGFTCNGAGNQNDAQTDGITVDVGFYAEQSRNNPNFQCSALPPLDGGDQRPEVGAALGVYTQTQSCDIFVDKEATPDSTHFNTIQGGVTIATVGQTVCVDADTYDEDVVIDEGITLAGTGALATTVINGQAGGQTGAVGIAADNVTVSGFQINAAVGSVAALRITGAHSGATVSFNKITGASGGGAVDTVGGQSNHTFNNNEFVGVAGSQLVYVNGLASVNVASTNVDFTQNTFSGAATMALGQEAGASSVTQNKFSAVTGFTDVEDWGAGNLINQNNFNDAVDADVLHSENGNTSDTGTTNAENNWWGDADPSDGDAGADVDFTPSEAVAFPEN